MNVVEKSKFRDEEGVISFKDRAAATIDYGFNWYGMMQSQEFVTNRLGRVLGDKHYLLRNIDIPGVDEGQPFMVLVSPQGVRLIVAYPSRGVFRAKDDSWLKFETRSRKFRSVQPNLQTLALDLLKKVKQLLEIQGHERYDSEAVLIFTHPRTLIDSARPITRVLSADAIEYFAANIEQNEPTIHPDRLHNIVDALLYPQIPEPELAAELLAEIEPQQPAPSFKIRETVLPPEEIIEDETIQRLESFFQAETHEEPYTPVEDFEPSESEHAAPFYPDSLETYKEEIFQDYQEPVEFMDIEQEYPMPDERLTRPEESFGLTEDPYASPDPFAPTGSYAPKFQEKSKPKRLRVSGVQWIFLAILGVIEFGILLYFAYVILNDLDLF
jgi:hypothetical protein